LIFKSDEITDAESKIRGEKPKKSRPYKNELKSIKINQKQSKTLKKTKKGRKRFATNCTN
jgi:hypothetical protein